MNTFSRLMLIVGILSLVFGIAACGAASTNRSSANTAAAITNAEQSTVADTPADPNAVLDTIEIHSFDMGFRPATITVDQPGRYTVKLVNDGVIVHDITFPDGTKIVADAGKTASADIDVPADGLSFICAVPGHEQAGMIGTITVGSAAQPAASPAPTPTITAVPRP